MSGCHYAPLLAALLTPAVSVAKSPPNPCGNLRTFPTADTALYPPGPTIPSDSQLGIFIKGVQPACSTTWFIEIESDAGTQRFDGTTDYASNAWLVRPTLRDGEEIEVRAYTGLGPEWVRTYVVDDSTPDTGAWELDFEPHRVFYTAAHWRGGVKTIGVSVATLPIPRGDDYAVLRLADGTELGSVPPGWNVSGKSTVDRLPRDGDEGCLLVEQRRPDGVLVAEYEHCAALVVTDLRRCQCSSAGPGAVNLWAMTLLFAVRRRRRRTRC